MRKTVCAAAAMLILAAGAYAADTTGVTIYPGAKYDEQWSKLQAEMAKATAGGGASACYRTKDPVKKVAEFYRKEGFKVILGDVTDDSARMQKGADVSLTIKNMKSLDNTNDARVCIVRSK
jgi:hypothetical protein